MSSRILVPTRSPEDWKHGLAKPEHWKPGHSAWALAHSWESAGGFPPEIETMLSTVFGPMKIVFAIPEWQVSMPARGFPSHTDLWLLAETKGGTLVSIAVEGKVEESFDQTIGEWLEEDGEPSSNRLARIAGLRSALLIEPPGDVHYQLLHRAASAVFERARFHADHAVMIVHSFSVVGARFEDFARFAALYGITAEKGVLHSAIDRKGATLHLGWAQGEERFLR